MADATVVVQFDGDEDFVVCELDATRNLDSSGDSKSEFDFTDEVYFYVHFSSKYEITSITKTSGSVTYIGNKSYSTTERIQFEEKGSSIELGYIPSGTLSYTFYGNNISTEQNVRTVTNTSSMPCICDITYNYTANLYKFTPPTIGDVEEFPVLIVIYIGEK